MTNKKFTLEAEQKDNGRWEGEMEIESDKGLSTVSYDYDTLHELMADLQTKAVFQLAEMSARESLRSNERD